MARPKKNINEDQVRQLAAIDCSYEEMAAVLDCDPRTLQRRFAAIIEKGRHEGKMSLKRRQWKAAMDGNITMLIWLGKQKLGQTDKVEQRSNAYIESKSSIDRGLVDEFKELIKNGLSERPKP